MFGASFSRLSGFVVVEFMQVTDFGCVTRQPRRLGFDDKSSFGQMRNFILFSCLVLGVWLTACQHDPFNDPVDPPVDPPVTDPTDTLPSGTGSGVPCDPDSVYFQNTILPLLVANCSQSGCHNPTDHSEGVVLNTYSSVLSTVEHVTSTDWNENKLIRAITETDPEKFMPQAPNPPLSAAQINLLKTWISQGAQNNGCNESYTGCSTDGVTYANFFQPLVQAKCQGCHSAASAQGGIVLSNYNNAKTLALNGRLYAAVTRSTNWMPNGGARLDACTIDKIKAWADAGAPQN